MGSRQLQLGPGVPVAGDGQASRFMGSVDVIVDEHTVVVCDGHAFMGDYSEKRSKTQSEPHSGSLVVRVHGRAVMGRVNVKRKPAGSR